MNPITNQQFFRAIEELSQFVAIPSVSNPYSVDYNIKNLERAALFVQERLDSLGFKNKFSLLQPGTAPYVIAEKIVDCTKPIILLYAHYDVQPVDRTKWNTDPFVMTQLGNRLYGRGASDDKAGIISIITALRAYEEADRPLPVNVRILVEGDEEYGSMEIGDLLAKEAHALNAHALVILDGANRDVTTGTIENSTRGVLTLELQINALNQPVHSGVGVLVPDPIQALAGLIATLKNPREIPGFMDGCEPLSLEEIALLTQSSQTNESYAEEMGVIQGSQLRGDPNEPIYQRIVTEPSLSVLNITSGQKGGGNSIQSYARCTIGIRLTPGQDPEHIENVIRTHLSAQEVMYNLPFTIEKIGLHSKAWKGNISGPFTKAFLSSLQDSYGQIAVMPTGGALPLITDFENAFPSIETIIAGVEDPYTAAHSHNESQDLGVLRKTTDALISFLEKASHIPLWS